MARSQCQDDTSARDNSALYSKLKWSLGVVCSIYPNCPTRWDRDADVDDGPAHDDELDHGLDVALDDYRDSFYYVILFYMIIFKLSKKRKIRVQNGCTKI